MKLFGYNLSIGKEPTTKAFSYGGLGRNAMTQLNINKNTLYDLYKQNPDIRSCTRKIAQYVGKKGFYLENDKEERVEYEQVPKDYDLIWLLVSNPTFTFSRIELFKHLFTCGELYLLPTVGLDGKVNGFQVLHPKSITKIVKDGVITGYIQSNGYETKSYFSTNVGSTDKKRILIYYQLEKHTDNELNGMGLNEGLLYDVMSDIEASKRNYYFFENGATPPSIIMLEGDLTQDKLDLLASQFKERYAGTENAHKPLFGVGIKDVKPITMTPKDMEHIEQKKMTIAKIASAYGVPRALLGYTEGVNYNNASEMAKEFIEGTIIPYQELLEFILNSFIETYLPEFNYYVCFEPLDYRDVFELDKIMLEKLGAGAITLNEYREIDGRDPYDLEEADKPIISKNYTFLEDLMFDPIIPMEET